MVWFDWLIMSLNTKKVSLTNSFYFRQFLGMVQHGRYLNSNFRKVWYFYLELWNYWNLIRSDSNHINAKSKFAASPNFDAHHSIHFWTVKLHWLILALVVLIKSDQKSMKIHKSYFGILNIPNLGFTWHNFSVCKFLLFCQIIQSYPRKELKWVTHCGLLLSLMPEMQ